MKVLLLHSVPLEGSGSGTYTENLACELSVRGHKVTVLYPGPMVTKKPFYTRNIEISPVPVFTNHPTVRSVSFAELSNEKVSKIIHLYINELLNLIAEERPDLIHVQHAGPWIFPASLVASVFKIPVVVTLHGTGIYLCQRDPRMRSLVQAGLQCVNDVISVSTSPLDGFKEMFGSSWKSYIIPGGVDIEKFSLPSMRKKDFDEKYNLKGKKIVLFVGRLVKEKGVQVLIQAAKKHLGKDVVVVISGNGNYENTLKKMASDSENIRFLPYLGKKIIDFYIHSDVVCVPSVWPEALGLVILEAMAAKTPVVASNIGGIPSVIRNGENGILVNPNNPEELANAINDILSDYKKAEILALEGRKTVEKSFSWEAITNQIEEIYERTLSNLA
ncbi:MULTISPECIES: glycosyltransferase family 4 protein [Kosmotoga]|uniref:Glycosyl transferase group 1 n=1 Tax=Kosmotoga olearia (strain ATCC BAA-1733 / DSM 21960 / TBF 19.5.1) TaxID=521045 RepID=C5CHI6_KOSOT|nr:MULTISPECIES: glycosyltransferase family 4 protein [Kosmotoga]ACR79741.1 glycosyl transferase group 1 [Kosmotoga olearia TBF 19.5.1]